MRIGFLATLAAGAALCALTPAAAAYRTGPPVAHTGGFGEPTCAACHFQGGGAGERGSALTIHVPTSYEPGARYDLRVTLNDPAAAAAGFQLTARFADGETAGAQAGSLAAPDSSVQVMAAENGIAYASHTAAGTRPPKDGVASWRVRWMAPVEGGRVVFHAAGNAANDDDSEFGDRIHLAERTTVPR